jgi:hypothetical protein
MKNLFTSKKSLENVSIPSVQKIKNELYNEVDETQKTNVSEDSFVDSGIKVLKTTDYNKLRLRKDNRPLDFKHVQRLVNSFKENGVIIMPGIINADNEIIDGQHRWAAVKQISEVEGVHLPFYFIIENDYRAAEMILLNAMNKNWNKDTYLHHHAENDRPQYVQYREFRDKFDWANASTGEIMYTGRIDGANYKRERVSKSMQNELDLNITGKKDSHRNEIGRSKAFQFGLLETDDINLAYERGYQLEALGQYYKNYANTNFVKAFLHVKRVPGFSFQELCCQFEKVYTNKRNDKYFINDDVKHTIDSYRDCMNDIYNFKKHENKCLNLRSVKRN